MTPSRLAPIPPGSRPELAAAEARIVATRGRVSPLYQVLLHSPVVAEGWEALLTAIRQKTAVPADLRELVILRVAMLNGAPYEFEAHVPHALAAGLPAGLIDAVRAAGDGPLTGLEPPQAEILALTDAMTRGIEVPDAVYAPLAARYGHGTQLEIVATVAAYNMVSRLLVALRLSH
ncbi:carboxymuconolactone decarboxylase family protein [Achromobacter sp. GG226]|uniref:carboxymuconolactone decarboxylase family protein n=1 Tax=Verticiella alkaliphila TaxID=2779529 RepID=UPI001C0B6C44|nr:carboxymuconolactone decarboxylase family protein [Verticiella sp. GG226]MBU4612670.1 carboxymuconolactone decarboxylase family protein [Verticiella sp. GG226]